MKRSLYLQLIAWKKNPKRKPLILQGARQVGKTFLLKQFGQNEFENMAYFNFEENENLHPIFEKDLNPERIIKYLNSFLKDKINPKNTLIIFDEIQRCPKALNALKYFFEKAPEYFICAAGSLLGVAFNQQLSFPVGKVSFLELFPLNFLEFLSAQNKEQLREWIEDKKELTKLPQNFQDDLISWLKQYYYVGGMPEAVEYYTQTQDWEGVRKIQNEILKSYFLDFSKYASASTVVKIHKIWEQIPLQLAKENKRFTTTALGKNARLRDYEESFQWLKSAGLIYSIPRISRPGLPLMAYKEESFFKVYFFDTGLLAANLKLNASSLIQGHELFTHYFGALVENFVAQEFKSYFNTSLYYWASKGEAELDFVFEDSMKNEVIPIEVKAGLRTRSHSLSEYQKNLIQRLLFVYLSKLLKKREAAFIVPCMP